MVCRPLQCTCRRLCQRSTWAGSSSRVRWAAETVWTRAPAALSAGAVVAAVPVAPRSAASVWRSWAPRCTWCCASCAMASSCAPTASSAMATASQNHTGRVPGAAACCACRAAEKDAGGAGARAKAPLPAAGRGEGAADGAVEGAVKGADMAGSTGTENMLPMLGRRLQPALHPTARSAVGECQHPPCRPCAEAGCGATMAA